MIIRKSIPAAFSTDPTSVTSRLLGSRPLHFLGVISYTIYMTHLVILNVFTFSFGTPDKWPLSTYVLLAATTCVVFVGTYLAWKSRPATPSETFSADGSRGMLPEAALVQSASSGPPTHGPRAGTKVADHLNEIASTIDRASQCERGFRIWNWGLSD
ncbi:MAG: hypothetical protein V7632_1575 [Bradyrhizobium sp.]|jgi:hypothetical protein